MNRYHAHYAHHAHHATHSTHNTTIRTHIAHNTRPLATQHPHHSLATLHSNIPLAPLQQTLNITFTTIQHNDTRTNTLTFHHLYLNIAPYAHYVSPLMFMRFFIDPAYKKYSKMKSHVVYLRKKSPPYFILITALFFKFIYFYLYSF